jgi:hypothetical protein
MHHFEEGVSVMKMDRYMSFRQATKRAVLCVVMLSAVSSFGAITSENNVRLRRALKGNPDADTDKDGILSLAEARAFKKKMKGGGAGQVAVDSGAPAADKGPAYSGLYMGHSFFRPSAQALDRIVAGTPIVGHKQQQVFAGGINGSPLKMWTNPDTQARATKILDSGDIELLVMTYYGQETSLVEHYCRWFDYAISKRPDVAFMVALPWAKNLHLADQARLNELKSSSTEGMVTGLIEPLRKKYPNNKVLYCPYGLGTYELIDRFNDGKLPGVKHLLDPDRRRRRANSTKQESLFADELSHPNDLIAKVGALLWLQTLYDYDRSTLAPQTLEALPGGDIREIAEAVYRRIEPLNALYRAKETE